jgi:hypothetical protein
VPAPQRGDDRVGVAQARLQGDSRVIRKPR